MLKDKWLDVLVKEAVIMRVGLSEQIILIFFSTKSHKRDTFSKANA